MMNIPQFYFMKWPSAAAAAASKCAGAKWPCNAPTATIRAQRLTTANKIAQHTSNRKMVEAQEYFQIRNDEKKNVGKKYRIAHTSHIM